MIEYFFAAGSELRPWDPHDPEDRLPVNTEYFRGVFTSMERHLEADIPPLRVFLTGRSDRLPEYGQDIVTVITGDECGRPPLYAQDVGISFKCYGTFPQWEAQSLRLDPLNRGRIANSVRNVARGLPYIIWARARALGRRIEGGSVSPVYEIPLGYNNQLDLPVKPIEEREIDVFFAGTVEPLPESVLSIRRWVPPPKTASRRAMIREMKKINERNPSLKCEIRAAGSEDQEAYMGMEEYSHMLMDSKICLVPRGNNIETWRFFEAIRYGCIVITEKLPNRWYYKKAPVYEIKCWNELKNVIKSFMEKKMLNEIYKESVSWWSNKCSEGEIGILLAKNISKRYD